MNRKLCVFFFAILLLINIPVLGAAAGIDGNIVDEADILTVQEEAELNKMAVSLSETYQIDVLIVTKASLNGESPADYAESLYSGGSRGWWATEDAILFLLDMDQRDWFLSTGGEAIYVFTDYGLDSLGEIAVNYLSQGEYFLAFASYMDALPTYFEAYLEGMPIDGYISADDKDYSVEAEEIVYYEQEPQVNLVLSFLAGIVVSGIALLIMRGSMNTQRAQSGAGDYMTAGSYNLYKHTDLFLHSQISKVRRQQNTSSNSRGGGSSIHRSSGGSRHGGRGGKF